MEKLSVEDLERLREKEFAERVERIQNTIYQYNYVGKTYIAHKEQKPTKKLKIGNKSEIRINKSSPKTKPGTEIWQSQEGATNRHDEGLNLFLTLFFLHIVFVNIKKQLKRNGKRQRTMDNITTWRAVLYAGPRKERGHCI